MMKLTASRSVRWQLFVLTILALGGMAVYQCGLWIQRPMFSNSFGRHPKGGFLCHWIPEYPHSDRFGNVVVADYRLNLLVVFFVGDSDIIPARFLYPRIAEKGVTFPALQDEDRIDFFVPRTPNSLIAFQADGSRQRYPLLPGEAERVYSLLDDYSGDFRSFLKTYLSNDRQAEPPKKPS